MRMTHTKVKGLPSAPISVKTPLFIPTVFLQLKIASNESILGQLFLVDSNIFRVEGIIIRVSSMTHTG